LSLEYKISKVITLDVGHFWLPSTTFILSRARSNLVKKKSGIHKDLKEKKSKF
jgi:hypothetical protein